MARLSRGTDPHLALCLDRIVRKACHKDPARRHQSARELQRELLETIDAHAAAVPMMTSAGSVEKTVVG